MRRTAVHVAILLTLAVSSPPVVRAQPSNPRLVTFFLSPAGTCPSKNWSEAKYGKGRLILGTTHPERVGKTYGQPFRPADFGDHQHVAVATNMRSEEWATWERLYYDKDSAILAIPYGEGKLEQQIVKGSEDIPFQQLVLCEQEMDDGLLDALPVDTVAFFNGKSCPERSSPFEWVPYAKANGRFVVPLVAAGSHEKMVNEAWTDGPPKSPHFHGLEWTSSGKYPDVEGDGKPCWNCGSTKWLHSSDPNEIVTWGKEAQGEPELPYVELLACRKKGEGVKKQPPIPPLMTFFRATADCADRFRVPASAGRFLVGLPENATPNQAFGQPLKDGEDRQHTHTLAVLDIKQGVDVGNGKEKRNIARFKPGWWRLLDSGRHMPYVQLSHCWPTKPIVGHGDIPPAAATLPEHP